MNSGDGPRLVKRKKKEKECLAPMNSGDGPRLVKRKRKKEIILTKKTKEKRMFGTYEFRGWPTPGKKEKEKKRNHNKEN